MARASSGHAVATSHREDHDEAVGKERHSLDPGEGERKLMQAVLSEAIVCLTGRAGPARERYQLAAEALRWVRSKDMSWPFSFESICDVLGVNADSLRRRPVASATLRDGVLKVTFRAAPKPAAPASSPRRGARR